jgi:hypothetical protein
MDFLKLLETTLGYCIFLGLPTWFVCWFIKKYRNADKIEVWRLHKRHEPSFLKALAAQSVESVEVLRDNTDIGSSGCSVFGSGNYRPFQIHMIWHSQPNRWFVYLYVEGSEPVLNEISEKRCLAAVSA